MHLAPVDWAVIAAYCVFALAVGVILARRAGQDVEQYFLSGRSLPWWIAGTSMIATSFASDTPLVITGWVRSKGIWQNWQWWCFAVCNVLTVFLFARYWRRGRVMTTAELAELRYGGKDAGILRFVQGVFQAGFTNTIVLCWVILAAAKIMDVLFTVDKSVAVALACALALVYSVMSGFWGVVMTDLVQFVMAMAGSILLAYFALDAVGGASQLLSLDGSLLSFLPETGSGALVIPPHDLEGGTSSSLLSSTFWTPSVVAFAVFLGVQWWAYDLVDGGGLGVQRISASRTERDGVLAMLWYSVVHYALRPWPWILVALASLLVLPSFDVEAPTGGTIGAVTSAHDGGTISIVAPDGTSTLVDLEASGEPGWRASLVQVKAGDEVEAGGVLAKTDDERAYVAMMVRFLPAGLLGLMVASLLAAFMSTVDTHVNLASSFFVNDIYRRFMRREAEARHYVLIARLASVAVLVLGGIFAWLNQSIGDLFTFFLSFLAGVGPVYVLRWLWWRVRAGTEIAAMLASSVTATWLTFHGKIETLFGGMSQTAAEGPFGFMGLLATDGWPTAEGRILVVVAVSLGAALASLVLLPRPHPTALIEFYTRVRPVGAWGPVRALCPEARPVGAVWPVFVGTAGGLMLVYGLMFAIGNAFLGTSLATLSSAGCALLGAYLVVGALREQEAESRQT